MDLVTGALVLLAATAALAGPVTAAMLMHRHGVVLGATAPAWGVFLLKGLCVTPVMVLAGFYVLLVNGWIFSAVLVGDGEPLNLKT
ncbi:hypothetical protein, partial [Nocardia cyriacigeorgica]|uniref:hypothetical protein n=1 Tax=Nocardia cyriacigeorgica TaxID=135487 RepID=UPI002458AFEB